MEKADEEADEEADEDLATLKLRLTLLTPSYAHAVVSSE
jgi:hypothetical protein